VSGGLGWWQVVEAQALNTRIENPQVIAARRGALRGTIFDANGQVLASSQVIDGISRRTYLDAAFSHLIGYASLRFGTTGVERAYDDILTGRADPNPLRDLLNDILARQPEPKDLTLTVDRRLQDFAAAQLGDAAGAIVAIDPRSGAILAMTSTPTFDATPISGVPADAGPAMEAITARDGDPLVDRARQGRYVPGSIMKVFTAAAALDAGVITPQTTYPDQPQQETQGFVVQGFTIREHDLGSIQPALWPLSPALQVSSNIFFAHVGLDLGAEQYLEYARRFGFCAPRQIGPGSRGLPVSASYVTAPVEDDCGPFTDDVELASAAFGQAQVNVTPVQMALLASVIANDGVLPDLHAVRDVRAHAADPAAGPADQVLERTGTGGGTRVISPQAAQQVRAAMVDAVEAELGQQFAGAGAVRHYGISGVSTAGKTGTAQRSEGQAPHSWFIGFAPGQEGAEPAIAVAVLVEGGGSGSGLAAPIGGRVMAEWLRLGGGG
ncbi:MAG TPA: penicillin-binding protein 2, partial [Chloroflexota bacterium]|nr:penicillin-binding protein 2 [Chloroflexota bacterium]